MIQKCVQGFYQNKSRLGSHGVDQRSHFNKNGGKLFLHQPADLNQIIINDREKGRQGLTDPADDKAA
jgi:hypothetical protein